MGASNAERAITSLEINRSRYQSSEESFGPIFTDIAILLCPPPKTAAKIANIIGCWERNAEACLAGAQKWSGDAVAAIIAEVLRRHAMRNVKIKSR